MFDTVPWDKLSLYNKRVFIGHCRKATIGGVTRQSAHPYSFGPITGVHNGTVHNWRHLPGDNEITDSAMIFKNFAETGVKSTVEALDGAYAFIWWDEKEGLLNILKNNERTLFYCFSEDCEKIFWASEAWMLSIALARAGIKIADLSKKEDKYAEYIKPVENDVWWRIRPGAKGDKEAVRFLPDESVKGGVKKAGTRAPFQGPFSRMWADLEDDPNDTPPSAEKKEEQPLLLTPPATTNKVAESGTTSSSGKTSTKAASLKSQASRVTLTLVHDSKRSGLSGSEVSAHLSGNGGLLLDEDEFTELVDPNCVWCQVGHTFEELKDQGKLGDWVDDDKYVCSSCMVDGKSAGIF